METFRFLYVLLLGLSSTAWGSDKDRCPPGLYRSKFLKVFNGQCYQFNHYQKKRHDAQAICSRNNGHLVVIKDQATQDFLMRSLKELEWSRNGVWIGADDMFREMHWRWITGEKITYSNWGQGQPSCKPLFCSEDCAILRYTDSGKWHDKRCNSPLFLYSFVCQYKMAPVPTTTTTTTTTTTKPTTTTVELKIVQEDLIKKVNNKGLNKVHSKQNITSSSPTSVSTSSLPTSVSTSSSTTRKIPIAVEVISTPVSYSVLKNELGEHKQLYRTASQGEGQPVATTTIALSLGLLLGVMVGVCFAGICFVRRRRRKEQAEDVSVSYNNPYYGEATQPLNLPQDQNEADQTCVMEFKDEKPLDEYDTTPSMSLMNPTYGEVVHVPVASASGVSKDDEYDLPKPTPCGYTTDVYANSNPVEENFYEDIDSIKAQIALSESLRMADDPERYVSMPTKNV